MATEKDAPAVAEIYRHYVLNTSASFEEVAPTAREMAERIRDVLFRYPWLVAVDANGVRGYVYATAHRARSAYRWSVDVTVYVHPDARRQGVGRALYAQLLPILRELGYQQAFAGITLPNAGSVGLHESMGFRPIATYERVGYKLGRWHDTGWWQLTLDVAETPEEPSPFDEESWV